MTPELSSPAEELEAPVMTELPAHATSLPFPVTEADTASPLWTKVGAPGPERPAGKAAILDVYNTLFVPRQSRCTEEEIAALRQRGLTPEGALLLRKGFFAGNIGDLTDISVRAIKEGGFTGILTYPNNDTGPNEKCACPYLAGMFGKDPKDIDLLAVPELRAMPDAFITLLNERATEMYEKEFPLLREREADRANIRAFHLKALEIVYAERAQKEGGLDGFEAYWEQHGRDGDRLLDYAVAKALEEKYRTTWQHWPEDVARKKPADLIAEDPALRERVRFLLFTQQILGEQWSDCADAIGEAGGYLVEDRAYSVLPHNAEVWRDWREQYVEKKGPGIFHLNGDRTCAYLTGCAVPGDPAGDQEWPHVVAKYIENPDGVIDYVAETIAHGGERVKAWRIDHALAWVWQYYRRREESKEVDEGGTKKTLKAWTGEYKEALKEKIFARLRERFPDTEWILEDCGHTEPAVREFMKSVGTGPMVTVQWGPNFDDPKQRRSTDFETYGVLPHGGTSFFRSGDTRADEEWFRALTEDNQRFYLGQLYPHDFERKWKEHVTEGKPVPVTDWIRYMCRCDARVAIVSLQSMSAMVEGKRDERRENIPGKEHPSFWQLLSTLSEEDLGKVFRETRRIIEETGRAVREVTKDGPLQILALSQQPGEVRQVERGGVHRLRIACNKPPRLGTMLNMKTTMGQGGWNRANARITGCTHHADKRFIWDVEIDIPADTAPGTYELSGSILRLNEHVLNNDHHLCELHQNLLLRVA